MSQIPTETYEAAANRLTDNPNVDLDQAQVFATLAVAEQLKKLNVILDNLFDRDDLTRREY